MSTQFYGETFVTQEFYIQAIVVHTQGQQKDILRHVRAQKVYNPYVFFKKEITRRYI